MDCITQYLCVLFLCLLKYHYVSLVACCHKILLNSSSLFVAAYVEHSRSLTGCVTVKKMPM